MQVPASATTASAESATAAASSSLFGALGGASSAKKGHLPPFAAILSEQSFGADTEKDMGDLASAMGDRGLGDRGVDDPLEAILPGTTQAGSRALLSLLPVDVKTFGDAQNETPSGTSTSSKNDTRTARHHSHSDSLSTPSGKKQSSAAVELVPSAGSASAPLITTQVIPAVAPEKWSHSLPGASLPSGTAPLPQHSSMIQNNNEEPGVQSPAVASPAAKSEATPLAADFSRYDLQPQPISSAKVQVSNSSLDSEASGATASVPESAVRSRQASSVADILPVSGPPDGLNHALAGSGAQIATSQATAAPLSKSKAQEKANGDIVRGLPAPVDAVRASSMDTHGVVSVMGPSARTADPVDSSPKQEPPMPDANSFQRLDSGGAPATLLHSSAHQIAVGVHDPSLGWLEVQTQSSAGHISATLTAASTEAHASLAAQAPAITQYLADRNVSVHSVNVHAQADTQSGASSGGGQPQSGTGNARHEVSEHGSVGMEESRSSSLSQTGSEHTQQTRSSSYISIHA